MWNSDRAQQRQRILLSCSRARISDIKYSLYHIYKATDQEKSTGVVCYLCSHRIISLPQMNCKLAGWSSRCGRCWPGRRPSTLRPRRAGEWAWDDVIHIRYIAATVQNIFFHFSSSKLGIVIPLDYLWNEESWIAKTIPFQFLLPPIPVPIPAKCQKMVKESESRFLRNRNCPSTTFDPFCEEISLQQRCRTASQIGARGSWSMSRSMLARDGGDDSASENLTLLSQ